MFEILASDSSVKEEETYDGLTIVLNGCFDLLHEGHIARIGQAVYLSQGGSVYILLNSDQYTEKLKGPGRPIDKFEERMAKIREVVTTLRGKDTGPKLFFGRFGNEEGLIELLDRIQPDMLIKGNDYTDISTITGFKKWPILITPRYVDKHGRDISTTEILRSKSEANKTG